MNRVRKSLGLLLPSMRISFSLALITACMLLSAEMLGYTLDEDGQALENRKQIAESLAIQFSVMAPEKDIEKIEGLIRLIVERNSAILSAGITHSSGQPIFQSPDHARLWQGYGNEDSTSSHILVPLLDRERLWGNVELRFAKLKGNSLSGFFQKEIFKLIVFCVLIGFFAFLVFMLRTLRQLDPSAVIPDRVNAAFDALAEGVMILDEEEHILLTNKAFSERIGQDAVVLMGKKASRMKWKRVSREKSGTGLPWTEVLKTGTPIAGAQFDLTTVAGESIKYAINASPITGPDGKIQGVLVTLDDITQVEEQNVQLKTMVNRLEKTQEKVQEQNKELTYLATRDALTGCLNRRAFSENFEVLFDASGKGGSELSCIMVDLDHFKLVNDNFGHAVGDEVIIMLAEVLKASTRKEDLVSRYGGEEFCLVLPGMSVEQALSVAERIRLRIKDESNKRYENGPRVTASIGVASMRDNPENPGQLNIFADEALYCAKENGRNRCVTYPTIADIESASDEIGLLTNLQGLQTNPQTATVEPKIESLQNRIVELEDIATQFSSELEYNKSYDNLTGLPNQALFFDRISQGIERGARHDELSAVLILDIEMFSQINASLGREGGDALLKEIAERLNSIVRKSDGVARLSVSRVAGDEFAVLFNDIPKKEQVTWAVKRLLDIVNQPVDINGSTIYLKCHVGISLYPTDADNVEELVNNAMSAKQFSKTHKSEYGYQFYDQRVQELSVKHLHLEADLHRAIENEEWTLLYQPKLDVAQREVIGVEALIRWNHPERGMVSPIDFIEFAEQRGLIVEIGDWVIKEACRQLRSWMDQGIHDCKIAINVSSVQLIQSDIVHQILNYLDEYKVPPRLFEIEITETILMENVSKASDSLERLHARGISIAIDDFGTGYSSLSYLKTLPIDSLKIDRGFVHDICTDDNDQKIVKTLISMAHSMGMKVVAEGVETRAQFDLLSEYEVNDIQGYLLSKPVSADEIEALMQSSITIVLASENVVQLPVGVKARAN
jgi:diguanylate cyclase (GGDEF)-like protein/PAS domain S-box-containing protein